MEGEPRKLGIKKGRALHIHAHTEVPPSTCT